MTVAALRDDVRMLNEQELIGNQPALPLFDQLLLNGECLAIAHAPQVSNSNHAPSLRRFVLRRCGPGRRGARTHACRVGTRADARLFKLRH